MKTAKTIRSLRQMLNDSDKQVGFVPTMGALHEGHLTLVRRAVAECPVVVVSIFVNPTQFNDRNDLKNYPRTPGKDKAMLGPVLRSSDIIFTPSVGEMYPEEDTRQFSFGNLDRVMEALHRPGHFNGVAQVVSKLFAAVKPGRAYFGIKDFQQLAVIKELARQMNTGIEIVPCEIVREEDGLAMSSRNALLEPEIRKNAPVIYRTLAEVSRLIDKNDIGAAREYVFETINSIPGFSVQYFEVADDVELVPVRSKAEMNREMNYHACIAVNAGKIRLIDNIKIQRTENLP